MTYCAKCGKEITMDAKFCPHCGQPVPPNAGQDAGGTDLKSNGKTLIRSVWKWAIRMFFGLVTVGGLLSVILGAISAASGRPPPADTGIGVFWWSVGVAYFFKTLSWKKSEFVKKNPIIAGLFSAWLIASLIYAVAMIFIHRT